MGIHFIVRERKREDFLDGGKLPSKQSYTCANHPNTEAFCLCAKCGAKLCENCAVLLDGRRYCEACMADDDGLLKAYEREVFCPKEDVAAVVCEAPQRWSQVPQALLNMVKDSGIFFRTAAKTPLWISFILAFVALLPNSLILYLKNLSAILANLRESRQFDPSLIESIDQFVNHASNASLVGIAVLATVFKIILLDLAIVVSVRVCVRSRQTWREICSAFHYCLLPFIFAAVGSWFEWPLVNFMALGLMIIQTSTAVRAATNCTLFQGLLAMLSFIFLTTLSGILAV